MERENTVRALGQHQVVIGFRCADEEVRKEKELKCRLEAEHEERDYQNQVAKRYTV